MSNRTDLLEILQHKASGFAPVVDYQAWRVALLNYTDTYRLENLRSMQRHDETDEVFTLLRGSCILYLADGEETVGHIHGVNMEPHTVYNVKKSTWHTHTLSKDAMVLIVENRDTTYDNSPFCELSLEQRQTLMDLAREFWKNYS